VTKGDKDSEGKTSMNFTYRQTANLLQGETAAVICSVNKNEIEYTWDSALLAMHPNAKTGLLLGQLVSNHLLVKKELNGKKMEKILYMLILA
jgi:hypothetical protein